MSLFESTRGYQFKNHIYPSVTTICDMIRKKGLENWLGNTPKEIREKQVERGKRIGTAIHANFDSMFKGVGVNLETINEEERPALYAGIKFVMEKRPKTLHSEMTVVSEKYGYAGTLDRVLMMPDKKIYLADFKTNNLNKYTHTRIYPENYIQVSAYKQAFEEMFGSRIDGGLIIALDKDDLTGVYELGYDVDPSASFEAFKHALGLFKYIQKDFENSAKVHAILCEHCYQSYKPKTTHECKKEIVHA